MHHIEHSSTYDTAILIKYSGLKEQSLRESLINPSGLKCISFSLDYGGAKKPSAKTRKEYLATLLPVLDSLKVKDLLVCDGEYFKTLTGTTKADPHYGAVLACTVKGYEHFNVVLCPQPSSVMFNPAMQDKIDLALSAMVSHKQGNYTELGTGIIHSESYPTELNDIRKAIEQLHQYPVLSCDIEAFSLKHYMAGIGTIGFAWDMHNGIAIPVDHLDLPEPTTIQVWDRKDHKFKERIAVAEQVFNAEVRKLLKEFFETYKGKLIWHNAGYDCTVLIYQLWMDGALQNQKGLLEGLEVMTRHIEDTKIISYLATNSCAGNKLSLKDQAHEFAGNYAQSDINDIRLIESKDLLRYNLVDCLSTWYVYEKNRPIMIADNQQNIYETLFMPSIVTIIQMQLTGMCLDMDKVLEAEAYLNNIRDTHVNNLLNYPLITNFINHLRQKKVDSDNLKLKNKVRTLSEVGYITFNPNSSLQLRELLYDIMQLPVLDLTTNKQPAVGNKTLKKLINHATKPEHKQILTDLIEFSAVDKILAAFIPTFKEAPLAEDGMYYLFGNFNLGGTVSGRLSSSGPNLQQIPSNSKYAKLIKACFVSAPGWIFCGADSASLEDRIDALQTKDPNKLKVYLDGFDGHSLRAFTYFPDRLPGIVDTVESINSIGGLFADVRQDSKPITFALTYEGNYKTLMTNCGFSEAEARRIESSYLNAYAVSVTWKEQRIKQASKDGYAVVAFGLRVRTPVLHKSLMGTSVTPYQAAAEGRTVGNAMGQSYGLLNSRAGNFVMEEVRKSKFRLDIKPVAQIHDALYFYVKDSFEVIEFLNNLVSEAMSWQDLPEIQHDLVKLSGELDIFYPSWKDAFTIPNYAKQDTIKSLCLKEADKRANPKDKSK